MRMRFELSGMALVAAVLVCAAALQCLQAPPQYKGKEEVLPTAVASQPIPFSHKLHSASGATCLDCHTGAKEKERAGLPGPVRCMFCHRAIKKDTAEIQKLAALQREEKKLNWVRVYQTPDFVFFSHVSHVNGGIDCETCHGPVKERDALAKEVSTSMTACMNCHAAKKVSNDCHFCHTLGY